MKPSLLGIHLYGNARPANSKYLATTSELPLISSLFSISPRRNISHRSPRSFSLPLSPCRTTLFLFSFQRRGANTFNLRASLGEKFPLPPQVVHGKLRFSMSFVFRGNRERSRNDVSLPITVIFVPPPPEPGTARRATRKIG